MQKVLRTVDCSRGEMKWYVYTLEDKMNEGFNIEGIQRKNFCENLDKKWKNNFEAESVKTEAASKNEENARQLVRKQIADMKKEVKNETMGISCTVVNEASSELRHGSGTFARLPLLTAKWTDPLVPRKPAFKKSHLDITLKNIQGIPDNQVKTVLDDLEKMMPQKIRKWIN